MAARTRDQLYNPQVFGPMYMPLSGGPNSSLEAVGRTAVASGTATVTVSNALVNSDSIIHLTVEASTRQSSGAASNFEVSSIISGVSFVIATADGVNHRAAASTVMWQLIRTTQG
jgi:hypothetical protein